MDAKTAKTKNGSCTFDGIDYILTQQACADNSAESKCGYNYSAKAKKAEEWDNPNADTYTIIWDVIDTECDDDSTACDWDNPTSVTKN